MSNKRIQSKVYEFKRDQAVNIPKRLIAHFDGRRIAFEQLSSSVVLATVSDHPDAAPVTRHESATQIFWRVTVPKHIRLTAFPFASFATDAPIIIFHDLLYADAKVDALVQTWSNTTTRAHQS